MTSGERARICLGVKSRISSGIRPAADVQIKIHEKVATSLFQIYFQVYFGRAVCSTGLKAVARCPTKQLRFGGFSVIAGYI